MAKIILMCGKICSGKSTYAKKICKENNAVILSCDEITLEVFGGNLGEKHDETVERIKKYLLKKSLEIFETGTSVILDTGLWQRAERNFTKDFSDDMWKINIAERNKKVNEGKVSAYFVDDGLAEKFRSIFEEPEDSEIDVRYINVRK